MIDGYSTGKSLVLKLEGCKNMMYSLNYLVYLKHHRYHHHYSGNTTAGHRPPQKLISLTLFTNIMAIRVKFRRHKVIVSILD